MMKISFYENVPLCNFTHIYVTGAICGETCSLPQAQPVSPHLNSTDGEAHMKVWKVELACLATIATCTFTGMPPLTKTLHCFRLACIRSVYKYMYQPRVYVGAALT